MSESSGYAIDQAHIVSEVIDGEAIIVNLANGYYYSLDAAAAEIWGWLQSGWSVARIVSAIRERYDCAGANPESAVDELIGALVADEIIAPGAVESREPPAAPPASAAAKAPFRAPSMQRFTDMQGFLLVDPIHEVDDTGWPHATRGESPASRG